MIKEDSVFLYFGDKMHSKLIFHNVSFFDMFMFMVGFLFHLKWNKVKLSDLNIVVLIIKKRKKLLKEMKSLMN